MLGFYIINCFGGRVHIFLHLTEKQMFDLLYNSEDNSNLMLVLRIIAVTNGTKQYSAIMVTLFVVYNGHLYRVSQIPGSPLGYRKP